jgi:hypothetical protein
MIIINIVVLSILLSCENEDVSKDVVKFVNLVKEDKYKQDSLPCFTYKAIPELLKYANDFSEINHFPINPFSTYGPIRLTVGECLLWTIEAIRVFKPPENVRLGFPSFVPELGIKGDVNTPFLNDYQLNEVYILYKNWWENDAVKDFEITRQINPLKDSQYAWR